MSTKSQWYKGLLEAEHLALTGDIGDVEWVVDNDWFNIGDSPEYKNGFLDYIKHFKRLKKIEEELK